MIPFRIYGTAEAVPVQSSFKLTRSFRVLARRHVLGFDV
jgi:hypothetical protein